MPTDDRIDNLGDDLKALKGEREEDQPPRSGALAALALLVALGSVVMSAWLWWDAQETAPEIAAQLQVQVERLQQTQNSQTADIAALGERLESMPESDPAVAENLQSELSGQQSELQSLQQELDAQKSYSRSLQQAVEAMQSRLMAAESRLAAKAPARSDNAGHLNLAGVGYLLRLAPERLTLYQDLRSADDALAMADAQLAAMDNPVYIGLRQHIAEARRALARAEVPNAVEISAEIDQVQSMLAELSFATGGITESSDVPSTGDEQGWWDRLIASMSGLVTVRRTAEDADSRLTLEDKDLLRQGLWLQLEGARLALMRHDQSGWEAALSRATGLLERWFDRSGAGYASVHQALADLASRDIAPDLPDISGPWAQYQLIREASGVPSAPPPEPATPAADQGQALPEETGPESAEPEPEDAAVDDDG